MIRYLLFAALAVAIGYSCYNLGQRGALAFERLLVERVTSGLAALGADWARVEADGLAMRIYGHAPDVAARDMAIASVRAAAPLAAVTSYATATLAPPEHRDPVRVEFLRDEHSVTLTGQTASRAMRDRLNQALTEDAPGLAIEDLTGIQAARPPRGWGREIGAASLAAARLPNAFVAMQPGQVTIDGTAADEAERERLTEELLDRAGDEVSLVLRIRVPEQVIAPFAFSAFRSAGAGIRLERCAARSYEEQAALLDRLSGAGVAHGSAPCPVGLGGPSGDWTSAVAAGLRALGEIPAGRIDIEYGDARLIGLPPTAETGFEQAAATFRGALPEGFSATAELRGADSETVAALARERYWMRLSRHAAGIDIRGQVPDPAAKATVETAAAAVFGADAVTSALAVPDAPAPPGWRHAAVTTLGFLQKVTTAVADLRGDAVSLRAEVADPTQVRALHDGLQAELPEHSVQTAIRVDLPAALAAIPLPPAPCAMRLNATIREHPIAFATGSAALGPDSAPALDALAAVLSRCAGGSVTLGSHTDSRGSESFNARISQARAEAVAAALVLRGVPRGQVVPVGYGEERPTASNETEAGRARNRRIEFQARR